MYFTPVTPGSPLFKRIRHTRTDQFLYKEQSQNEDGTPYDYTGHEFKLEIKKRAGDAMAVVTMPNTAFSTSQSQAGIDANVLDIFKIDFAPDDFTSLIAEPFEYYFDIQITDAAGKLFTPIKGVFIIIND